METAGSHLGHLQENVRNVLCKVGKSLCLWLVDSGIQGTRLALGSFTPEATLFLFYGLRIFF